MKKVFFIVAICLYSCGVPYNKLDNGVRVPKENYRFKNQDNFNKEFFNKTFDCNYFYVETDRFFCDRNGNEIKKMGLLKTGRRAIQFYTNGNLRWMNYTMIDPSPQKEGNRGIVYFKNNKIFFDIFIGGIHTTTNVYKFEVKQINDRLYVIEKNLTENYCYVFEKKGKISNDYTNQVSEW